MTNPYIGMIDILGFSSMENASAQHGDFFQNKIFESLDRIAFGHQEPVTTYHRYGDGYVFEAPSITSAVLSINKFIATALSINIPLRAVILSGQLTLSHSEHSGLTVSGSGWNELRKHEGALNWVGGLLYLPQHDASTHEEIQELVSNLNILRPTNHSKFPDPIKSGHNLRQEKYWYLNWQKPLKFDLENITQYVNSWWAGYPNQPGQDAPEVGEKKRNTIEFGNYCWELSSNVQNLSLAGVIPSSYYNAIS